MKYIKLIKVNFSTPSINNIKKFLCNTILPNLDLITYKTITKVFHVFLHFFSFRCTFFYYL